MNISINRFEDLTLYSNKNIEKMLSTVVAESSNAVLVSVYEDGAILLDHTTGQFYMCEYKFEPKDARVLFENFEPITLLRDNDNFRDTVYDFFESDDVSVADLTENYKDIVLEQDKFLDDLVAESMIGKNFDDLIDYNEIAQSNKEHGLFNESFFQKYMERLSTHPLTEAKYFNWNDPVQVSLVETEQVRLLNSTAREKAHSLWKHSSFKEGFVDIANTFIEDVESGIDGFVALFEEFPQVFYLDKADRKTMFGKIIINEPSLRESRADLLKGLDLMFENEEQVVYLKEQVLAEEGYTDEYATGETRYAADAFKAGESTDFTGNNGEVAPTRKDKDEMFKGGERTGPDAKDVAVELNPEDIDKLVDALKGLVEKLKAKGKEKETEKVEKVAEELERSKELGTLVPLIKESVSLLSL